MRHVCPESGRAAGRTLAVHPSLMHAGGGEASLLIKKIEGLRNRAPT